MFWQFLIRQNCSDFKSSLRKLSEVYSRLSSTSWTVNSQDPVFSSSWFDEFWVLGEQGITTQSLNLISNSIWIQYLTKGVKSAGFDIVTRNLHVLRQLNSKDLFNYSRYHSSRFWTRLHTILFPVLCHFDICDPFLRMKGLGRHYDHRCVMS